MSHRYVTVTVETRAGEDDIAGEEITAIYNFDLEEDGCQIEEGVHKDIHDHLLNLLEQYREEHP
ncbi:MAG: hypothetical protein OXD50_01685 [Chloroflexi bacterium]|nr:hypothetical protein [Chloroflexota bacterium]